MVAFGLLAPAVVAQQVRMQLTVYVYDDGGLPMPDATVIVQTAGKEERGQTSETGRLAFSVPDTGVAMVLVRRVGYAPATLSARLPNERFLEATLTRRVVTLDMVRVRAQRQFAGIVASSDQQLPIAGARVSIVGDRGDTRTDSSGTFTLPMQQDRSVALSVERPGFTPTVVVERLDGEQSREMVILLDPIRTTGNRMYQAKLDRAQRVRWRGANAGSVGGRELRTTGARRLADALRESPSVQERGLVIDDGACLFLDGEPQPGFPVGEINVELVKLVEFYDARSDFSGTLAARWPRNARCGTASGTPGTNNPSRATWVVVWTR